MFEKFFDFIDRHAVVATTILYAILYLTYTAFSAMIDYAITGDASIEKAGIIAAILTPVTGLLGAAVKFYNDRKLTESRENNNSTS